MGKLAATDTRYVISIGDDPTVAGGLRFTFVPAEESHAQSPTEYVLLISSHRETAELKWIRAPEQAATRADLESIARARVALRRLWIEKLDKLVEKVTTWATELEWSAKRIQKRMEDSELGDYLAPALLVQKGSVRLFLEPVARAAPGAEGVVDLYLMPSYDDIASLYYYNGRWNVHYVFPGAASVAAIDEAAAMPLTKPTIERVFREMSSDAQ